MWSKAPPGRTSPAPPAGAPPGRRQSPTGGGGHTRLRQDIGAHACGQGYDPGRAEQIVRLLACPDRGEVIVGVLDGLRADFALGPLPGEASCREDLHPFNPAAQLKEGDVFRYRPLGCPITHFARVLRSDKGIATVHLVGPVHLLQGKPAPEDIGICMVAAFEGLVSVGRRPEVGETVRFLPELLYDAEGALRDGGALGRGEGEDRGD